MSANKKLVATKTSIPTAGQPFGSVCRTTRANAELDHAPDGAGQTSGSVEAYGFRGAIPSDMTDVAVAAERCIVSTRRTSHLFSNDAALYAALRPAYALYLQSDR